MSSISAGTTVNTALVYTADSTGTLQIKTGASGATAIAIDANQNVGIGTSTPTFDSGSGVQISRAGVSTLRLSDTTDSTNLEIKAAVGAVAISGRGNYPLLFETNGISQASLDTAGLFKFNSGYGSVATAYGCRAWVNFSGATPTIRGSGNVTSISKTATGDYTLNLTTALPDVNYASLVNGAMNPSNLWDNRFFTGDYTTMSTTACKVNVRNGSGGYDNPWICVGIFR